jgi:hypothetical protein
MRERSTTHQGAETSRLAFSSKLKLTCKRNQLLVIANGEAALQPIEHWLRVWGPPRWTRNLFFNQHDQGFQEVVKYRNLHT